MPYIAPGLRPLAVPIASLTLDPANVRTHDEKNLAAIRGSLARFGQRSPVVVQRQGMIVRAGNGRLLAAKALGWSHMAALVVDEGDVEATAFAIADNRTAELAGWDDAALAKVLGSLPTDMPTGFDEGDVAELLAKVAGPVVEDEAPEPLPEPVSKRGDVWVMGGHRLLCGDSTDGGDVALVMDGERAALCITSPPYAQQREYTDASKSHTSDWNSLMCGVFGNLCLEDSAQVLVNLGVVHRKGEWWPYWDGWIEWMREQGWKRFGWYVWDQGPGLPGDWSGRFAPSHEFVFHFNKHSKKPAKTKECAWAGSQNHGSGLRSEDGEVKGYSHAGKHVQDTKIPDSVIRVMRHKARGIEVEHPAVFSVPFAAELVAAWPGDVYEPFSGSGTTIVACEQLGRRCYAIEIEPRYVDVAVRRWQKLTNKDATLESSGETWTQTATSRGVPIPS